MANQIQMVQGMAQSENLKTKLFATYFYQKSWLLCGCDVRFVQHTWVCMDVGYFPASKTRWDLHWTTHFASLLKESSKHWCQCKRQRIWIRCPGLLMVLACLTLLYNTKKWKYAKNRPLRQFSRGEADKIKSFQRNAKQCEIGGNKEEGRTDLCRIFDVFMFWT